MLSSITITFTQTSVQQQQTWTTWIDRWSMLGKQKQV